MMQSPEVAEVFRTEWPRLVAILVRDFGDLDAAEDAAQDAFIEAARHWQPGQVPDRPAAWLLTTARRKLIDRARRETRFAERLPKLANRPDDVETEWLLERVGSPGSGSAVELAEQDQLALLLGCCHPALHPDAQVALTLRAVAGLSTAQIARAFLVSESTMGKRLGRSKTKIREARIPFRIPPLAELDQRLAAVCGVIYAIYTEGHASATDEALVRGDLCDEAVWLAGLLASFVPDDAEVAGLHALLLLTDARRSSRVISDEPVLLADQDRTHWDHETIARGLAELRRAHAARASGPFQLQAAIAALHATAPSFDETDWAGVVRLYDVLLDREPTAIIALNRAIAVAQAHGPAEGLHALEMIEPADDLTGDLDDYVYFHAARAEMLADLGRHDESRTAYRRAISMSTSEAETRHLQARILDAGC